MFLVRYLSASGGLDILFLLYGLAPMREEKIKWDAIYSPSLDPSRKGREVISHYLCFADDNIFIFAPFALFRGYLYIFLCGFAALRLCAFA